MSEPLMPEREQEIRETQLGNWYDGPWTQGYVEGAGDDPAYYRVKHAESGTTLATLPDWAGPIALFIADAHDAVPELLAELDRVRAERDRYATQLDGLCLAKWEDEQANAEEAHPLHERWRVEIYDPLAKEWAPGTPFLVRDRAVERLNMAQIHSPRWADDDTPVARRLVRETTTYTVEAEVR